MGRNRVFDHDVALDRAVRLFWAKGYANTSMRDLFVTLGFGQGSFYRIWAGKKECYLECLKRYNETVDGRRWKALSLEPTIQGGIRKFFETILDDLEDPSTPNLCLMAGSLSPEVLSEVELRDYVVNEMIEMEGGLKQAIHAAIERGELPEKYDYETAAQVIVTFLQGLFRVVRVLKTRLEMERQVEKLLFSVGL